MCAFRSFTTCVVAAAALSAGVAPALAQGAEKYPLRGPSGEVYCSGHHVPGPSDDITGGAVGFAVFNLSSHGTVSAVLSIRAAVPRTTYTLRLIQNNTDCFTVDGTVTTNGQGNATVRLSEPVAGIAAQVIVDTGDLFATPTSRATDAFVY